MHLLRSAPRSVVSALRLARTGFLRAAGPFEGLGPRASSGPPLWIRRHTGSPDSIVSAARRMEELVKEWSLVRPGDRVLDAGCGFGVMAGPLSRLAGPTGSYLGFDLHAPSVGWAKRLASARADSGVSREEFTVGDAGSGRFPAADGEAGFLLAKSLFTHLTERPARAALGEICRTLAPGRWALVTVFLFEPGRLAEDLFPYPDPESPVRWSWRARPEAAIAFERAHFGEMLTTAGLAVERFLPGFWPASETLHGQDILLLRRQDSLADARLSDQ